MKTPLTSRPSPRPASRKLGWLDRALREYRLLLLDQRDTAGLPAFDGTEIGDEFLYRALPLLTFATGPLFAALHEASYAQGSATRWAATRIRADFPAFDVAPVIGGDPLMFTGEMIYPWTFQADPVLTPLADVAEILADYEDWPALYDEAKLAANEVPVAAAIYYNDMYVPRQSSVRTAAQIRGLRS